MNDTIFDILVLMVLAVQVLTIWIVGSKLIMAVNSRREEFRDTKSLGNVHPADQGLNEIQNDLLPDLKPDQGKLRDINLIHTKIRPLKSEDMEGQEDDSGNGAENFLSELKKGILCLHQHNHQEAIVHLDKTISMNPGYSPAYEYRAEAYFWTGKRDKGAADLEKARQLNEGKYKSKVQK